MSKVNLYIKNLLLKDLVIAITIALLPFVFFMYELVPEVEIWETKWFTFESTYFEDVNYFTWIVLGKTITILFLSLWFVTCKHWWRRFIFVPILFEVYRLFGSINVEFEIYNTNSLISTFLLSLPFFLVLIITLIFIAEKLNYHAKFSKLDRTLLREIHNNLNKISSFNINDYKKMKTKINQMKSKKNNLTNELYMKELYDLRKELIKSTK